ncbi:MAG: alpha/beta hydrolase [Chloroflexi bacterium]|nr:MAG: alpha/beta hydrolase [Chloroflexota bacterium]
MEINPVNLYYEEHGRGIPAIYLHGFPFDHTIWEPLIPMLQDGTRMILPDLRGFGRSPVTDGVYSMRLLAEDIVHLMNRLEIEKAVIVGHSMGGYVSLAFAQAYPGRLLGLGLVATHSAADNPERRQSRQKLAESVMHKGARVVASNMVNSLTPKKELIKPIKELILQANPTGISGALRGMAERHDLTGELSNITVPAVVIVGKADQLMPREHVETMAQMLPKGWLVEVPDAGHMLTMEDPRTVAAALQEMINIAEKTVEK